MDVIPVIDVRLGQAVRARAGERESYQPLQTPLAAGSDPIAVAHGLMGLFDFPRVYVADLDAIEGRRPNADLIGKLSAAMPGAELWIDDGMATLSEGAVSLPSGNVTPVVGTESLSGVTDYLDLRGQLGRLLVLSLDFHGDSYRGPEMLLRRPDLWPERLIVMTLARVGSDGGPDLARLREIIGVAGPRKIYAAGGVRGRDDLVALHQAGAAGALVASALHAAKLKAGDLVEIAGL